MQNIVIIGGAGYVGKNLCAMLAPNYKVIAWEPTYSLYTLKIIQSAWEYIQKG